MLIAASQEDSTAEQRPDGYVVTVVLLDAYDYRYEVWLNGVRLEGNCTSKEGAARYINRHKQRRSP